MFNADRLETLRKIIGDWASQNFSDTLPVGEMRQPYSVLRCASGMSEELSELVEAALGTTRKMDVVEDAIADFCIYALDLTYSAGIEMQELNPNKKSFFVGRIWNVQEYDGALYNKQAHLHKAIMALTYHCGQIHHHALKTVQKIRKNEDHRQGIIDNLRWCWEACLQLTDFLGIDLYGLVEDVARKVTKRDWKQFPDTAHEVAHANS